MYQGACVPSHHVARIDPLNTKDLGNISSIAASDEFRECPIDKSIYKIFKEHHIYDINRIYDYNLLEESITKRTLFTESLDKMEIISKEDYTALYSLATGNLSTYKETRYTDEFCDQLTPVKLSDMLEPLKSYMESMSSKYFQQDKYNYKRIYTAYQNSLKIANDIYELIQFERFIKRSKDAMRVKINRLDKLIAINKMSFGKTIETLTRAVESSQRFIRSSGTALINSILKNLTDSMKEEAENFRERLVLYSLEHIGRCAPLAYIHRRDLVTSCEHMVDPIVSALVCLIFNYNELNWL